MTPSITKVDTDDGSWELFFETDFDGIYPVEWKFLGMRAEPPMNVRNELERRAYSYYHERRSGAYEDYDDE